jgi:mevalonate kinase
MPAISAKAPAKLILLGEHAVVYGHPAIAVPIRSLWLKATCQAVIRQPRGFTVSAPQLDIDGSFSDLPENHPLHTAILLTLQHLAITEIPSVHLRVHANFPFSSGLGSSASLAVAVVRALSDFLGHPLDLPTLNALAYQVEISAHGTPSGVDNSVTSYNLPIWFVKGQTPQVLTPGGDFHFVIADTGVKKSTAVTLGELAAKRQQEPTDINTHYDAIGKIVIRGRIAFEAGDSGGFGRLMNENQAHLAAVGVSSAELDNLISASLQAGALGAKLTGGGRGGFMLALAANSETKQLSQALLAAGAKQVIEVPIRPAKWN